VIKTGNFEQKTGNETGNFEQKQTKKGKKTRNMHFLYQEKQVLSILVLLLPNGSSTQAF